MAVPTLTHAPVVEFQYESVPVLVPYPWRSEPAG